MELLPFLFIALIAFNIFRGFSKASSNSGGGAKVNRYEEKRPTQRGRESLKRKGQATPWGGNSGMSQGGVSQGGLSQGGRVAASYLKKERAKRRASHKNPVQSGRRGRNMDQNRNRSDDWGQRGDGGLLSGKTAIILLVIGAAVIYVLSNLPAS